MEAIDILFYALFGIYFGIGCLRLIWLNKEIKKLETKIKGSGGSTTSFKLSTSWVINDKKVVNNANGTKSDITVQFICCIIYDPNSKRFLMEMPHCDNIPDIDKELGMKLFNMAKSHGAKPLKKHYDVDKNLITFPKEKPQ